MCAQWWTRSIVKFGPKANRFILLFLFQNDIVVQVCLPQERLAAVEAAFSNSDACKSLIELEDQMRLWLVLLVEQTLCQNFSLIFV
jgi:hypothetical protein